jgi:predicted aspartyl protease
MTGWRVFLWTIASTILLALPASGGAQDAGTVDGESSTVATTMSATDRMLVPVTIANSGPYPFIVDTAAENSVIARDLVDELALPSSGRASLLSVTSLRPVGMVDVHGVSFVEGSTRNLRALVLLRENIGAAGILGIDALRGQRVELDFAANQLTVSPAPRREVRAAPNEIIVRARRRLRQLILADCSIDGTPVDVIVDSGTQVSLGNEALRKLLTTSKNKFEPISLISVTGEQQAADYTRADRLVIGTVALAGMPVAFADAYIFQRLRLNRTPALLLGMDALQMFDRVSVDFQNNEARFLVPEGVLGVKAAGPLLTRRGRLNTQRPASQ